MRTKLAIASAAVLTFSVAGVVSAQLGGREYRAAFAPNNLADAITVINTQTFNGTFLSTVVNGPAVYSANDNDPLSTLLNADAPSLTPATEGAGRVGNMVLDIRGFINVPVAGVYTFSTTSDDGSAFYVDPVGTPGSGTQVANDDGLHGNQNVTQPFFLSAGQHAVELIWFNHDFGGGGAFEQASITDPNGAPALLVVPEPASMSLLGLGSLALLARRRRA